jgi:septation ring formation regulator EzrA
LITKLKERRAEMDKVKKEQQSINEEIQVIYKNVNERYKTEERVAERLKEIDTTINTVSLKPA